MASGFDFSAASPSLPRMHARPSISARGLPSLPHKPSRTCVCCRLLLHTRLDAYCLPMALVVLSLGHPRP